MNSIAGLIRWGHEQQTTAQTLNSMITALPAGTSASARRWSRRHAAIGFAGNTPDAAGFSIVRRSSGDLVLAWSGEIYNLACLRVQLAASGFTFTTSGAAEVALAAYQHWGPACAEYLDGPFCFAAWDELAQELVLATDRFGIRPLYYTVRRDGITFATELNALFAAGVPAELDGEGIAELTALADVATPGQTALRGISAVEAGTTMRYRRDRQSVQKYWTLQAEPHSDDLNTTVATIRSLLSESVRQQLALQPGAGTINSGNLSSVTISTLAASHMRAAGRDLYTFGLDRPFRTDAVKTALAAAKHLNSIHHLASTGDIANDLGAAADTLEFPAPRAITRPLQALFRNTARYTGAVLTGDGADELFRHNDWFQQPSTFSHTGWPWHRGRPSVASLLNRAALHHAKPRWLAMQRYHSALSGIPHLRSEDRWERRMRQISALTITYYLPHLLRLRAKIASRSNVQLHFPFIDRQLVEYVWNIPSDLMRSGHNGKTLLHQAVSPMLPQRFAWQDAPGDPEPGLSEHLREKTRDLLAGNSPLLPLLDITKVAALLRTPASNTASAAAANHITYLLQIDAWLRRYRVRVI